MIILVLWKKIGTIHRVDDNFNYPYIFNIDGFHWCFDDTEIILMGLQVINPIYSIYGFYAAVMASMSALWLLFDVMGI